MGQRYLEKFLKLGMEGCVLALVDVDDSTDAVFGRRYRDLESWRSGFFAAWEASCLFWMGIAKVHVGGSKVR